MQNVIGTFREIVIRSGAMRPAKLFRYNPRGASWKH